MNAVRVVMDYYLIVFSLCLTQKKSQKVVVVGGGYIGMEVAAAAVGWKLDTTVCMILNLVLTVSTI